VTKAALIHLVKSLAIIAGPKIRVNSVSPGVLMTVSLSMALRNKLIEQRTGGEASRLKR
jgi:NAD(P)-dependent dehydrogenase (short-subunit alcohol dehydrogenase family)